jgi:phage shock protein PspC (stress-responsive transcriptional regulator)
MGTITVPPPRRLHRSRDARLIAGIASGVAQHLGISPWLVRSVLVLLCGLSSLGLLLYTAIWAVLPHEPPAAAPDRRHWGALTAYGMAAIAVLAVSTYFPAGRWSADLTLWPAIAGVAGVGITRHGLQAVPAAIGATGPQSDRRTFPLRVLGGTVLIATGLIGGGPVVAIFLAGIGALAAVAVWRGIRRVEAERETRLRERQRAVDLAVIHDQTLQVLALIQRDAGDSPAVRRLAAHHERTARDGR